MPITGTSGSEERFQAMELYQAVQAMPTKTVSLTSSTQTGGAVTLNAGAGVITSDTLSLPGDTEFVLTVTNSVVTSTDFVVAMAQNGTNTQSPGAFIATVTPGAGVMTVRISNQNATAALNGTVKVGFMVIKQRTMPNP